MLKLIKYELIKQRTSKVIIGAILALLEVAFLAGMLLGKEEIMAIAAGMLTFLASVTFVIVGLEEIILCKSCFAVTFEVTNIYIKPDGFGKVKGLANFCNSLKYFGCSGFFGIVADDQIIGHTIVKKCFSP